MSDQSFQIFLSSIQSDRQGALNTDCTFNLPMIDIPDQHHIWLSVKSAVIPVSFYNVSNSTNSLTYSLSNDNVEHTVFLTNGNYNVITLTTALNALLNALGFTVTYNKITNKMSFTHTTYNFFITYALTSCSALIGNSIINQQSINRVLTSDYVCNLAPIRAFQIAVPHIKTGNISKNRALCQTVLCQIPITYQANGLVTYFNTTEFSSNLFVNYLHEIQIQILDQNSNLVNLNGVEWSVVLQMDILKYVLD